MTDMLTVNRLGSAIKKRAGDESMNEETSHMLAEHVLHFFGYNDRIIDNVLHPICIALSPLCPNFDPIFSLFASQMCYDYKITAIRTIFTSCYRNNSVSCDPVSAGSIDSGRLGQEDRARRCKGHDP